MAAAASIAPPTSSKTANPNKRCLLKTGTTSRAWNWAGNHQVSPGFPCPTAGFRGVADVNEDSNKRVGWDWLMSVTLT